MGVKPGSEPKGVLPYFLPSSLTLFLSSASALLDTPQQAQEMRDPHTACAHSLTQTHNHTGTPPGSYGLSHAHTNTLDQGAAWPWLPLAPYSAHVLSHSCLDAYDGHRPRITPKDRHRRCHSRTSTHIYPTHHRTARPLCAVWAVDCMHVLACVWTRVWCGCMCLCGMCRYVVCVCTVCACTWLWT